MAETKSVVFTFKRRQRNEGVIFRSGVNSTAILVLCKQDKLNLDVAIFADTGSEHPETYQYIENVVKPLCKEMNVEFVVVGSGKLFEDYWNKQIIPYRAFRSCTDKYKIRPIKKYVKENYGEVETILGIDYGEKHRAERYPAFTYPLIEMEIDREGCKRIINNAGYPIPIKSGCFFCPFTKVEGWKNLYKNHKDLFLKAEEFEKNCRAYPRYHLTKHPLQQIRLALETQKSLCDWVEREGERCVFCHE